MWNKESSAIDYLQHFLPVARWCEINNVCNDFNIDSLSRFQVCRSFSPSTCRRNSSSRLSATSCVTGRVNTSARTASASVSVLTSSLNATVPRLTSRSWRTRSSAWRRLGKLLTMTSRTQVTHFSQKRKSFAIATSHFSAEMSFQNPKLSLLRTPTQWSDSISWQVSLSGLSASLGWSQFYHPLSNMTVSPRYTSWLISRRGDSEHRVRCCNPIRGSIPTPHTSSAPLIGLSDVWSHLHWFSLN